MRFLFLSAALFNWSIALLLVFAIEVTFQVFGISPIPTEIAFVHFFSAVVFAFGIAYYWISLDPTNNKPLIKLGAVAKLMLVTVGAIDVYMGLISWQFMILLSVDLIYSILFFKVLLSNLNKPSE